MWYPPYGRPGRRPRRERSKPTRQRRRRLPSQPTSHRSIVTESRARYSPFRILSLSTTLPEHPQRLLSEGTRLARRINQKPRRINQKHGYPRGPTTGTRLPVVRVATYAALGPKGALPNASCFSVDTSRTRNSGLVARRFPASTRLMVRRNPLRREAWGSALEAPVRPSPPAHDDSTASHGYEGLCFPIERPEP